MAANNSIIDDIKQEFRFGDIVNKLIILNVGIYFITILVFIAFRFSSGDLDNSTFYKIFHWFSLPANPIQLLKQPWSLFSHMFLHSPTSFFHLLFNMISLYIFGRILLIFLKTRQFLSIYFLGGIAGAFLFIILTSLIPMLGSNGYAVGASAAIMSVVLAAATLSPDYSIRLIFLGNVKIKWIALAFICFDIMGLAGSSNLGGHIAHLGGAIFGILFITQLRKGNDWSIGPNRMVENIGSRLSRNKKPTVAYVNEEKLQKTNSSVKAKSSFIDEDSTQQKIDAILDKISEKGYDSLSKKEKEFLFKYSKDE